MGFYFTTYICNGLYRNINDSIVDTKIEIAKTDAIIEKEEWYNNKVGINDMKQFLEKYYPKITLVESNDNDLFLAEYEYSTLMTESNTKIRYLIIAKNYKFTLEHHYI